MSAPPSGQWLSGSGQARAILWGKNRTLLPSEASSMKYCCLGVFRTEYLRLVINSTNKNTHTKIVG